MLSKKEIDYLFDFTRKKRVRYKDVQIELVDHLATAIEDKMGDDNEITFLQALDSVYSDFGIFGFAKIVEEKSKALTKFWKRRIFKHVVQFFKLPRIILTLSLFLIFLELFHFQILRPSLVIPSFAIVFFVLLIWLMYYYYFHDNEIRDFLYVQSYYGYVTGIFFFLFYINPWLCYDLNSDLWVGNEIVYIVLSFILTFLIIYSYVCFYYLPRELMIEFKSNYSKYLPT